MRPTNELLVYLECSTYFFRIRILSTSHGVGGVFSGSHTSLSTFDTVQIGQKSFSTYICSAIKLGYIKKNRLFLVSKSKLEHKKPRYWCKKA